MAKMKLAESTFTLIPEGITIFKIMEVDESKYEDYGKLKVVLQTARGEKHTEQFSFKKKNGDINEGALKAWSYFARTCLNNFQVEEIDTQDIVGCYIKATVKHETYIRQTGDKAGEEGTAVRLNDYCSASGFDKTSKKIDNEDIEEEDDADLDDLDELDDL
ncbi:hypothetical protein [Peptostreptococcus sp. D1]|uniref:hypothetical protein n=1 Tax=Peptostreptococcus sp. D1 TaxID=72304 RepID=UPI0008E0D9FC|nr:hypothetical protein [Peptostreptococcus sp. D1]SFE84502.1 hypothetical protein SAMN02910278_01861 [Peptostreptococcus sp. D1]